MLRLASGTTGCHGFVARPDLFQQTGSLLLLVKMRSHCLTWVTYCARHTVLEPMSVSLSVQRSHCLRLGAEHSNLESGRIEFSKQLITVKGALNVIAASGSLGGRIVSICGGFGTPLG